MARNAARRRGTDELDDLSRGLGSHLDVDPDGAVHPQLHVGADVELVVLPLEPQGVDARWELGDPVVALRVGHRRLLAHEVGRGGAHDNVTERLSALMVDDRTHDVAALRERSRGEEGQECA